MSKPRACNDATPRKGCRYLFGQARRGLGCPFTITFVLSIFELCRVFIRSGFSDLYRVL
uniref:Uncharacterized protein n=1 Tax=Physcomitrium patens TaxID=3218 RepID=A0A2K1KFD5_PHYPA|nr:hypothetical protein PHYPA_008862 [Physcomitrium patens]